MNTLTHLGQQNKTAISPKEFACNYQCNGIDNEEIKLIDSYSDNLIGFSPESLMIQWLEAVFEQSIALHTTDSFNDFLINKKYAFSQFSEAGLITLKITDTTTSKYWYELQICATNHTECL